MTPLARFFKKNLQIILLILICLTTYFIVFFKIGGFNFLEQKLFYSQDSKEYLEVARWMGGEDIPLNPYRPFFYPLLIFIFYGGFGVIGLWGLQVLLFTVGQILLFKGVKKLSGNFSVAMIAFVICQSAISLVVYTNLALTETTVFFLLACLCFTLTNLIQEKKPVSLSYTTVFVAAILAVTKPVFYFIWLVFFALGFLKILGKRKMALQVILILVLVSTPVLIQKSIQYVNHGTIGNNPIGELTLKNYLFKRVFHSANFGHVRSFQDLNNKELQALSSITEGIPYDRALNFLKVHWKTTLEIFWLNYKENLRSANPYIDPAENPTLVQATYKLNSFLAWFHLALPLLLFLTLTDYFFTKSSTLIILVFSGGVLFYFLLTSGISFWAGDRLIIPSIALSAFFYPVFIHYFYFRIKNLFNRLKIRNTH